MWPDSPAYLRAAVEIAHHGDSFPHEIYRTPLYSTFLAIFLWFFDHSPLTGSLIILAQQLTGIFSAILIYVVAGRLAQGRIPLLSGIAYALSPLALYYEMTILTESLFVPIFLLTVYHVITILEEDWQTHRGWRDLLVVGILCAILSLIRPIGQFLIVPFLTVILFKRRQSLVVPSLVSILLFVSLLQPWCYVNSVAFGFWGISRDQGLNLFHRIFDVDELSPPEDTSYPQIKELLEKGRAENKVSYFYVYPRLARLYHSYLKADNEMGAAALETLKDHPGTFILGTVATWTKLFLQPRDSLKFCGESGNQFLCSPISTKFSTYSFPQNRLRNPTAALIVQKWFQQGWPPSWLETIFAFVGFLSIVALQRESRVKTALLVLLILYFSSITSLLQREEDRFRIPIEPFVLIFAISGVVFLSRYPFRKLFSRRLKRC